MHYSFILASLLAATGTLAAPHCPRQTTNNEVRVILQNQQAELGTQQVFTGAKRETKPPVGSRGPYQTIEVRVGAGVAKQDLRCQVLDDTGKPIVATRGANTDITFADGGAGPWTFKTPHKVSQIICDPAFKKAAAGALDVRVVLQNQATELGSQTTLSGLQRENKPPAASNGPYKTVELVVGDLVKQDLRCKVLDLTGKPIVVLRGGNRDITFADGNAGLWTFETEHRVSHIICDPAFRKGSA